MAGTSYARLGRQARFLAAVLMGAGVAICALIAKLGPGAPEWGAPRYVRLVVPFDEGTAAPAGLASPAGGEAVSCARGPRVEVIAVDDQRQVTRLGLPSGDVTEVPSSWIEPVSGEWVVGHERLECGLVLEYTSTRQGRLLGPGLDTSFSLDYLSPKGLQALFAARIPELDAAIPAARRPAFIMEVSGAVRDRIARVLGDDRELGRLVNASTGTVITSRSGGAITVNGRTFVTLEQARDYYRRHLEAGARPGALALHDDDPTWIRETALPTLARLHRGAPVEPGDHVHFVRASAPMLGGPPLTLAVAPGPAEAVLAGPARRILRVPTSPGLEGPVKLARDRVGNR